MTNARSGSLTGGTVTIPDSWGIRDGDMIIVVGYGHDFVYLGASTGPRFTRYRPGGTGDWEPWIAYRTWREGDPTVLVRTPREDDTAYYYLARSTGGGVLPGDAAARLSLDVSDLSLPSVDVARGDFIVTTIRSSTTRSADAAPSGFTYDWTGDPRSASLEASGSLDTATVAWTAAFDRTRRILVQQFTPAAAFSAGAFLLAATETRDFIVDVRGVAVGAVTVEGNVSAGSATFTATALSPVRVRVTAVAGAAGATVEGVRVVTLTQSFGRDAKTAVASATAEHDFDVPAWPYITGPVAQEVADDWAAHLNAPRQLVEWDVDCFGDDEFEACAQREISDRVRVRGIGSTLDAQGHVEAIQLRLSHASAGLYRFRMLT